SVELSSFERSLAFFFQWQAPDAWPNAEKTLNREALLSDAQELGAKTTDREGSAWGVQFSTAKLPAPPHPVTRDSLATAVDDYRTKLKQQRDELRGCQERYIASVTDFEKESNQAQSTLESELAASIEAHRVLSAEVLRLQHARLHLEEEIKCHRDVLRLEIEGRDTKLNNEQEQLGREQKSLDGEISAKRAKIEQDFKTRKEDVTRIGSGRLEAIEAEEHKALAKREEDQRRAEEIFQKALNEKGVNQSLLEQAKSRLTKADLAIRGINQYEPVVAEYQIKKRELIDPLPSLGMQRDNVQQDLSSKNAKLQEMESQHGAKVKAFDECASKLGQTLVELNQDAGAVNQFKIDRRFLLESGMFESTDLCPAPFYRTGAVRNFAAGAGNAHEKRLKIGVDGEKRAKAFLNRFDPETSKQNVLGFSPIHEQFKWWFFVGDELKPFVTCRGIHGLQQIQTREFDQIIRNICNKNSQFQEGLRKVSQTAGAVEANLKKNNFVDVLDSIEFKIQPIDSNLTRVLAKIEQFADVTFNADVSLFGKRANKEQIDQANETFDQLVVEIDERQNKVLHLTDCFDFLIRVHENGRDMGWRKSLDHIGSTGTDYLLKMLIYLSLIEVFRERAIHPDCDSVVHCIMDETGVLAPKYIRCVLDYAKSRRIVLITAGHSQQTIGFENWLRVCKRGQRLAGQTVLRKVLQCD
ncbi:MAG: hypothetical protein JWM68_5669, partial [Verrucomicrobiales bacterium]|nr:hypothetical protein [Verrucomicrobiales bacterium]